MAKAKRKRGPRTFQDLIGRIFSHWTVISAAPKDSRGKTMWLCRCSCGTERVLPGCRLVFLEKTGKYQSCGCQKKLRKSKDNSTHGLSKTPEYATWCKIIERCCDANSNRYSYYGGRGIKVCREWRHDFLAFLNHVGKKPSASSSIERINNDGNYEPGNVRWATKKEQANNRRSTRLVTIQGVTKSIRGWVEHLNETALIPVSENAVRFRMRRGWAEEDAIMTPFQPRVNSRQKSSAATQTQS